MDPKNISKLAIQWDLSEERESRGLVFECQSHYCTLVPHAPGLMSRSIHPVTIHFQHACALYPTRGSTLVCPIIVSRENHQPPNERMSAGDTQSSTSASPSDPSRTIVLCFDGTGNQLCDRNTNIVRLFSMLKKDDPESQVCYYQAGIGTYVKPGAVSPFLKSVVKFLDSGLALYLNEHVLDGYRFLMQHYQKDDRICFFGFSRGAYIARALAGMLHKVGLLPKGNDEQIPFAYKVYKSRDNDSEKLATHFKKTFGREVKIDFLGVWDTVSSVGYLYSPATLPFVGSNHVIKTFRHALSLDERRAKFRPSLVHNPNRSTEQRKDPSSSQGRDPSNLERKPTRIWDPSHPLKINFPMRRWDTPVRSRNSEKGIETNALEVWFAGCHSDVGGGHTKDSEHHALSNVSLRWMVREVVEAKCGIIFDETAIADWNIQEDDLKPMTGGPSKSAIGKWASWQTHNNSGNEHRLAPGEVNPQGSDGSVVKQFFNTDDALADKGDILRLKLSLKTIGWWIFEMTPTLYEWQDQDGKWWKQLSIRRGHGRELPSKPMFHVSVKERMKYLRYTPKAKYTKGDETYYDTKATETYYKETRQSRGSGSENQIIINKETLFAIFLLLFLFF